MASLSRRVRSTGKFVDFVLGVFGLFAEGEQAEEFVAAGNTAESRDAQRAPKRGSKAIGEFACDALDLNIAADGAVSRKEVCEGSRAGTKAFGTSRTTPGHAAEDTGEVVEKRSSA
jgi:hypothetical protein